MAALVIRYDVQNAWAHKKLSLANFLEPSELSAMAHDAARNFISESAAVLANLRMQVVIWGGSPGVAL